MHTDELISLLASNSPQPREAYLRHVRLAIGCVFVIAILFVAVALGLRADLLTGLFSDPNRVFKYGFLSVLMVANGLAWWRYGQPGRDITGPVLFSMLFSGWLLIMCVYSFYVTHFDVLRAAVMNKTAFACFGFTFAIAAGAAAVLARIARGMAPEDGNIHAYLTALFAASIGAFAYALHCPQDQPLYLATWYGLAIVSFAVIARPFIAKKLTW